MRYNVYYKSSLAVVALAITAFYFFNNPAETNIGFQCLFYKTTGLYCTGCGGQRAFYHLIHGDFYKAFNYNLLIYLALPLVGVKFYEELFEKKIMPEIVFSRKFIIVLIIFVLAFTILRNLTFAPFNLNGLP